jgi:hypothetical protein
MASTKDGRMRRSRMANALTRGYHQGCVADNAIVVLMDIDGRNDVLMVGVGGVDELIDGMRMQDGKKERNWAGSEDSL